MKRLIDVLFVSSRRTLIAIFIVALLFRGVFILTLQDGFYFPDSVVYSEAAVNLITKGELGDRYDRPPGYPAFLAGIYLLFGESIFAIRMAESLLGALLAVIIALLGRRIGGEAVGALAGILWSCYPLAVFIAGLVYPTTLLTVLLAFGLLFFLPHAYGEVSLKKIFAAGVIWGLAALTKPIVLATLGAVSLWVICWGRTNRLLVVSLLFLGSVLTVVPWVVRDYYVYDRLVVVEPRVFRLLPRMRTADESIQHKKVEAILRQPDEFAARFVREFLHFWQIYPDRIAMDKPGYREETHEKYSRVVRDTIFTTNNMIKAVSVLSTTPIFLFAILGTAAMWFEQGRCPGLALLWAIILSFGVTYSVFFTQTRYRIPIEPYLIILSAYGLWKTWCVLTKYFAFNIPPAKAKVKTEGV